jgi:hypothetical protein
MERLGQPHESHPARYHHASSRVRCDACGAVTRSAQPIERPSPCKRCANISFVTVRETMPRSYTGPHLYDADAEGWNAGQPWSDVCVYDLIYEYERGDSIEDIRVSIQRNREEVEKKIRELGLDKMSRNGLKQAIERVGATLPKSAPQ